MTYMEKNLLPPYQPPYNFLCGRVFERANLMASELSLLIAVAQMMSAAWSLCLSIWSWRGMAFSLNSVLFAFALLASVSHLVPGSSSMIDLL